MGTAVGRQAKFAGRRAIQEPVLENTILNHVQQVRRFVPSPSKGRVAPPRLLNGSSTTWMPDENTASPIFGL